MSEISEEKCGINVINILDFSNGKKNRQNAWLDNFNVEMEIKKKNLKMTEIRKTVREIKNAFEVLICTLDKTEEIISECENRSTEN